MTEPSVVECEGCAREINARFAACPFCGHQIRERASVRPTSLDRRPGDPPPADTGLIAPDMPKEARIAMATAMMTGKPQAEPVTGPISAVMSALRPSPATRGGLRTAEIVLTVISFPFFVVSIVGLLFSVKRWGQVGVIDWVSGALFGTCVLGVGFYSLGVTGPGLYWGLGVMFLAWNVRGALRFYAAHQRMSDYS